MILCFSSRLAFFWAFAILLRNAQGAVKLEDPGLKNSKTGASFTNLLVTRLLDDLSNIAQGEKKSWHAYYSVDVAAVEAIISLQNALFDLSAYFAASTQGFVTNKYLSGVALEYSTTKCDSVTSNKYPRNLGSLPLPWSNYEDSLYYLADCRKNASDISKSSYYTLHARGRRNVLDRHIQRFWNLRYQGAVKARTRRFILNDPTVCGTKRLYEAISGNFTSPGYPGNYSGFTTCTWHIKVPVRYAVAIYFDMFNLEYDKECHFDSLEFFDGGGTHARSLGKFCGSVKPTGVRSSLNIITIRMKTDSSIENSGFVLGWNYTAPNPPHPGFLVTSNIVVDQTGPLPKTLSGFSFIFKNPRTCGLQSKDVYCYFQYETTIISRIIATSTLPMMNIEEQHLEVIFEHIIDLKSFPTLYNSKLFCMRWNSSVASTDSGAWSRYGGKLLQTSPLKTVCRYDKPGIFAVIAEAPFADDPAKFRFTGSFYAGIMFSIVWIVVLLGQWAFSRRINVPEWLNFNQAVALLLFLGIVLSGLQLDFKKPICSLLSFLLYYFGLGVFFWQFLKAAQVTGKFDDFFAKGRNEYFFYLMLGWIVPIFIAGMAGGAVFYQKSETQSCWLALVGGSIWGYTSPTYFLVLGNLFMLYKVFKKTKKNRERFNHPVLRKRVLRDILQVVLFILTWVFGILCILNKHDFVMQYFFCISLVSSVLLLSLGAKQLRPGYQKIHFPDLTESQKRQNEPPIKAFENIASTEDYEDEKKDRMRKYMSMRAFKKWTRFKKVELKLARPVASMASCASISEKMIAPESNASRSSLTSHSSLRSQSYQDDDASSHQPSSEDEEGESEYQEESHSRAAVSAEDEHFEEFGNVRQSLEDIQEDQSEEEGSENNKEDIRSLEEKSQASFASLRNSDGGEQEMRTETAIGSGRNSDENSHEDLSREDTLGDQEEASGEGDVDNERASSIPLKSPVPQLEVHEDKCESETEEAPSPVSAVTINAFGADPVKEDSGMQLPTAGSRLLSRAASQRPAEEDAISVCSLEDEDEPDAEETNENAQENLYDISMY